MSTFGLCGASFHLFIYLQDCIHLTEEQYKCIAELGRDPNYVGRWSRLLSLPTWQALTQEEGANFEWIVFSEYLGTLKFGLLAKDVAGGDELYQNVLSVWEHLLSSWIEGLSQVQRHCLQIRMVFRHLRGGWFRVNLNTQAKTKHGFPQPEAKQYLQGLASDSFLLARSRVGIRKAPLYQDGPYLLPIKHLPGCEQSERCTSCNPVFPPKGEGGGVGGTPPSLSLVKWSLECVQLFAVQAI